MNDKLYRLSMDMRPYICDYLMSCAVGSSDGYLKASSHEKLTKMFVGHFGGEEDRVRQNTRKLTDHLEEEINFPLDTAPNYRVLWKKFFTRFIHYGKEVLDE